MVLCSCFSLFFLNALMLHSTVLLSCLTSRCLLNDLMLSRVMTTLLELFLLIIILAELSSKFCEARIHSYSHSICLSALMLFIFISPTIDKTFYSTESNIDLPILELTLSKQLKTKTHFRQKLNVELYVLHKAMQVLVKTGFFESRSRAIAESFRENCS